MKLSTWNRGALALTLLLTSAAIIGCGGGDTNDATTKAEAGKQYDVPPGADPSVSAEMGGAGFEKIAADSGWQTGTLSPEQFRYIADQNAKKGGMVTFALQEFPATFRQYGKDENSATTRMINSLVYEGLIGINPLTLEFLPALASHWKVGEDGQTYWFRIDPNARFSDGHPVTTDDVLATYKLAMDSTILSPYTNSFYATFDPPEAISKYIFKVRSKEKNWKNMLYFGGTTILPAHVIGGLSGKEYLDKYQYEMVPGSGPYIVHPSDVEKQKSITLTRRSDWWQQDYPINNGQYNFDRIRIMIFEDRDRLFEMMNHQEVDFIGALDKRGWNEGIAEDLLNRGLVQRRRIFTDDPPSFGGFVFNMRRPPFDDRRIREAFIYLFDREKVLGNALSDVALISSFYPGSIYANPRNPSPSYSPDRADSLLAAAGYTQRNTQGDLIHVTTGETLEIAILTPSGFERTAGMVRDELRAHGIVAWIDGVDGRVGFQRMNQRDFMVGWITWGGLIFPNPSSSYYSSLADVPNTNNLAGFKNTHADSLMDLELHTFNANKRVRILQELDSVLVASKQYAFAWNVPYTRIAYWNRFGHPDFYLGRISDWQSILSTWWVDPKKAAMVEKGKQDTTVTMPMGETDVRFWEEWKKRK